ncbi:MAG TPA: hypothetical protein PLO63_16610 [Syntrophales bacterium]|nr:hypothetical protein [Syntrophales bacterium]
MKRGTSRIQRRKARREKEKGWRFVESGFKHHMYQQIKGGFEGDEPGKWKHCERCCRAYPVGSFKYNVKDADEMLFCPYPDCEGDYVMDSQPWETVYAMYSDLPEKPERGIVYMLVWEE